MKNQEDIELINDYFHERLTPDKKKTFEERWRNDEDFAREITFYLNLVKGVKSKHDVEVQSLVEGAKTDYLAQKRRRKIFIFLGLIAAVILGYWMYTNLLKDSNLENNNDEIQYSPIAMSSYETYNYEYASGSARGGVLSDTSALVRGIKLYKKEKYKDALFYLRKVEGDNSIVYRSYLAIVLLNNSEISASKKIIKSILNEINVKDDELLYSEMEYYLALINWKEGNINECKTLLSNIIARGKSYSTLDELALLSDKILKKLNSSF